MDIEKLIKYGFMIVVIVLLTIILFKNKTETTYITNKYIDSIINNYKENTIYNEKEKLKIFYEKKTDSIIVNNIPDSILSKYIMSRARELLNSGQFANDSEWIERRNLLQEFKPDTSKGINSSEQPH